MQKKESTMTEMRKRIKYPKGIQSFEKLRTEGMVYVDKSSLLYELVNNELKLESDIKVYFNLICFGILTIAGYYAFMKLFMSSIAGGLDSILDLFG